MPQKTHPAHVSLFKDAASESEELLLPTEKDHNMASISAGAASAFDGPSAEHPLGRPILENVLSYLAAAGRARDCAAAFGACRAVWRTDSQMHWPLGRERHGKFNESRLHWASRCSYAPRVAELIDTWHSPIEAANTFGQTPLHVASAAGHVDVVRELLRRGAAVGGADKNGDAALHFASSAGHADVARALLDAGADANGRGLHDRAPLHYATSSEVSAKDWAAPANQPVFCGESVSPEARRAIAAEYVARERARMAAKLEVAELLLARGADANAKAAGGVTPLLGTSSVAHVRLLLAAGADVNGASERGNFVPLHFA